MISIIETYPEFKAMYEDVYELCRNTKDIMGLFSKELFELDKGTTKFMMNEMQEEIDELKEKNDGLKEENDGLKVENDNLKDKNDQLLTSMMEKDKALDKKDNDLAEINALITKLQKELQQLKK